MTGAAERYALFIDDERFPPDHAGVNWVVVRSLDEAVAHVERAGAPSKVSFDHDLGDGVPTGKDFANWLIERDLDAGGAFLPADFEWVVHSMNPIGAANIAGLMSAYLKSKARG
jgi:hypothetical protein